MKSWLDCATELQAPNDEQEVIKKGFECQVNSIGTIFPVGPLDLLSEVNGKQVRRMLMCQVAIGRAFPALEEKDMRLSIPAGYDSLYWDPSEANQDLTGLEFCRLSGGPTAASSQASPGKGGHESCGGTFLRPSNHTAPLKDRDVLSSRVSFAIKNNAQVLPRFIVEFEFDTKLERQSRQVRPLINLTFNFLFPIY